MKKYLMLLFLGILLFVVSCHKDQPTEPANNAPTIQSVTASPSLIQVNETTILTCLATDADGDSLTYSWLSDEGTFPNGTSAATTTWKAPGIEGTYKITVIVSDNKATAQEDKSITVFEGSPPCPGTPTVTYEGKTYHTVQIGNQCWLRENLDIGTMIEGSINQSDNGTVEKYCYNNDPNNCDIYGGLYQWSEAMQYSTQEGTKGICPTGWHIPTYSEWQTLQSYVNFEAVKLIDKSQHMGNGLNPTNETGFSALFAGFCVDGDDYFYSLGDYVLFWSSTEDGSTAQGMGMNCCTSNVYFVTDIKSTGFSIRCIKD